MSLKRIGLYCWAGSDTVKMINTKYLSPKMDIDSIMSSYDDDYLAHLKKSLGITDIWATFDWGFGFDNEQTQ